MLVRPVAEALETAGIVETMVRRSCQTSNAGAQSPAWQAVYVFHDTSDESLLCFELVPLMLEELERGRVDAFFFIRYWEGGKHLRLRFRSDDPDVIARLRRRLSRASTDNGTRPRIRPGEYEPEIERYGGPACIGLCETHFMLSSFHVWSRLRPNLRLAPDDLLRRVRLPAAAHDMMMIVRHAYGEPRPAIEFLRSYWNGWLLPSGAGRHERARELRRVLEREMDHQFGRIGDELKTHLLGAWRLRPDRTAEGLEGGPAEAYLAPADWSAGTASILAALRRAGLDFRSAAGKRSISGLIHMNNNRFGVLNRDEAFLAYLCERTLREAHA